MVQDECVLGVPHDDVGCSHTFGVVLQRIVVGIASAQVFVGLEVVARLDIITAQVGAADVLQGEVDVVVLCFGLQDAAHLFHVVFFEFQPD